MGAEQSQLEELSSEVRQSTITLMVNGKDYRVRTDDCDPEIGPNYRLVDYLRDKVGLTGTKYMCREGGCGACMVTIKSTNPTTGKLVSRSANSCLLPLFACDGLQITTVEGIGNRKMGYNKIQERLVNLGGTQCGFCTPGFICQMNSLAETNPNFTMQDVENTLDSNICRCTGYRPIVDAFKSLAKDASEELKRNCIDIEDMIKCPKSISTRPKTKEQPEILQLPRELYLQGGNKQDWFKVTAIDNLYELLERFSRQGVRYRLVAGNTGTGIYKNDGPYEAFIEINDIPELHYVSLDDSNLVLGAGVTFTAAISELEEASKARGFLHAGEIANHLRNVSGTSVRNLATLGGSLMLKHMHREFIGDLFVLLESVGAMLTISSSRTLSRQYTLLEFLDLNEWELNGKLLLSIHIPALAGANFQYRSYRLGKRHQSAIAYVNAGFLFEVDPNNYTVLKRPRIVYGGIAPGFIHANATEIYLQGRRIDSATLQGAMKALQKEVVPSESPESSVEYRRDLAQSFLYRFLLDIRGNSIDPNLRSGAYELTRRNYRGTQLFDSDRKKWPLYQPIPKIESYPQVSGEAEYINDIHSQVGELYGVFVLSTVANASIKSIDASKALLTPGVVAFITAKDVPGNNTHAIFYQQQEVIFADGKVNYAGQPVGLLVARDTYAAELAKPLVVIRYDNITPPTIDIRDVAIAGFNGKSEEEASFAFPCRGINDKIAKKIMANASSKNRGKVDNGKVKGVLHNVKGQFYAHPQYHFHMETQICICVPIEDGMIVYSATQHMDGLQGSVAGCLNMPNSSITVQVRRLGGGFGAKISKAAHAACACAVAAHVLNKPVRVVLDLETNMQMIGKRLPYLIKYEVDVDDTGKIHKLESDIWCDVGYLANESTSLYAMLCFQSCYRADEWDVRPRIATTDTAPNTYCRSPGSSQGVAGIESIMEHIAHVVKKDPLEVRQINFIRKGDPFIGIPGARLPLDNLLPGMISELKINGDFEARKRFVQTFNETNRWKKRGIAIVPQRYPNYYPNLRFPTLISIYHVDGSVSITHGGIEMGQGLNTKVAQVVAHVLDIPMAKIRVKPSTTNVSPNTAITGGAVASELVCSSARRACEILLERLAPIRKQLVNPSWEELIAVAYGREVFLAAQHQEMDGDLTSYDIWGVTMIEVEVDCLTGDFKIVRADLINDAGESLSPLIDIGQVEGALIMGLGWWMTEELIYDKQNGRLITDSTFNYKPMMPKDIPEDLRITFLRNVPNPFGVLSSKATGEHPFNTAICVLFALRNAINSCRNEIGNQEWYQMDGAVTREVVKRLCLTSPDQFTF